MPRPLLRPGDVDVRNPHLVRFYHSVLIPLPLIPHRSLSLSRPTQVGDGEDGVNERRRVGRDIARAESRDFGTKIRCYISVNVWSFSTFSWRRNCWDAL